MLWQGKARLQEGGLGLHPGMRAIARLVPPYPQPAVTTFDSSWPVSTTLAPFGPIWPLLATFGWWALQQGGMWGGVVVVGATVCAAPALSKGGFRFAHPAPTQYPTTSDNAGTSPGT